MHKLLDRWTANSAIFLAISLAATAPASAQAFNTARRDAEITPFVQTTVLRPDYGQPNNAGYTVGVDYTRFIRAIVQPSLEFRMSSATGQVVGERSLIAGFKLQASILRVHPYATYLVGNGVITFTHPVGNYYNDNSFVRSIGGGADFKLYSHLNLRADFTQQHWNLPPVLTPMTFSLGLAYNIPFHPGTRIE
jgi:hypothetical protein